MRLVLTTHKILYEKSAFSKKAYHQRDDGFILLKTNCYYTDERGNTYFCFAGVGEFDIDSTKNINYDDVLDKNAFIDAKDNVALNYILDNASVIDKSYTDSIQNRLKISDKKHIKIANALKEQELNVYNKEEINKKLENTYNDIQKLKDEIKALNKNYEKDLKQLQDKLSKNEQSIKNTLKTYKANDDKKEALQDERINTLLNGFDDFVTKAENNNENMKNDFLLYQRQINQKFDEFKNKDMATIFKDNFFNVEWDFIKLGGFCCAFTTTPLNYYVVETDELMYYYGSSIDVSLLRFTKAKCITSCKDGMSMFSIDSNSKLVKFSFRVRSDLDYIDEGGWSSGEHRDRFDPPRYLGGKRKVGDFYKTMQTNILIFGFKE